MRPFIFILIFLLSLSLNAQEIDNQPLKVGADAPEIKGKNQFNKTISSKKLTQNGSVIVVFYRGEWCGYCKRHLANLQDSLELITAKGASVIVITPEQPKYVKQMVKKTKATYSIISDKNFSIMEAYNVKYEVNDSTVPKWKNYVDNVTAKQNNGGEAVLPIPATYIINKEGEIEWVHFDTNYTTRSTVKEILEHI